jgi:hypothetical protein
MTSRKGSAFLICTISVSAGNIRINYYAEPINPYTLKKDIPEPPLRHYRQIITNGSIV